MNTDNRVMLPGIEPRRKPGKWERRAQSIVAALTKSGYLTPVTAGYGDALWQAGADRDLAELRGSMADRFRAASGWDRALARIVPPPSNGVGSTSTDDPWDKLSDTLRGAATMGDTAHT